MPYILTCLLFLVGIFGIFTQKNIIKIIISVSVIQSAANIFLVLTGYKKEGIAPIITGNYDKAEFTSLTVDPFPQAMVLTSIVIGLSVLALMVAIALRIYHKYKTYNITEIIKKQKALSKQED